MKESNYRNDQKIVEAIRSGKSKVLRSLYPKHKKAFVKWAGNRYQLNEADLVDAYQEAVIVFYQNVLEQKITQLNCSIQTYLFSVGKRLLQKQFSRNARVQHQQESLIESQEIEETVLHNEMGLTAEQELLQLALAKLGPVCQELLQLFYYQEYSTEAIMHRMEYKNTDTVKSQKARCMKQLKVLYEEIQVQENHQSD